MKTTLDINLITSVKNLIGVIKNKQWERLDSKAWSVENTLALIESDDTLTGVDLILVERKEQLTKHKRTLQADREFNDVGQLSVAAGILSQKFIPENLPLIPKNWNASIWQKMISKPYKERLIIAGALIAAEIDRVQFIEIENGKW